jgi:transcription elongation GreA/GreB family factor
LNYITAGGAAWLNKEISEARRAGSVHAEKIGELEQILASVTIVEPPSERSDEIGFGASVRLRDADGRTETFRVVGVDELRFDSNAVSWISSLGRTLLASKRGDKVTLEDGRSARIEEVEYPGNQRGE